MDIEWGAASVGLFWQGLWGPSYSSMITVNTKWNTVMSHSNHSAVRSAWLQIQLVFRDLLNSMTLRSLFQLSLWVPAKTGFRLAEYQIHEMYEEPAASPFSIVKKAFGVLKEYWFGSCLQNIIPPLISQCCPCLQLEMIDARQENLHAHKCCSGDCVAAVSLCLFPVLPSSSEHWT